MFLLLRVFIDHAFNILKEYMGPMVTFLWDVYFTDELVQNFEICLSCLPSSVECPESKPKEKKKIKKDKKVQIQNKTNKQIR